MPKPGSILSAGKKGVTVGAATTASAITSRRKRQDLEKTVPVDIIVINERVQLNETDFKPEENTDRIGFTQKNGYFPDPMSYTDLLNAKITFAKIFAKDSKFSLTDSKPPCDLEEYGVLRQGLENRFKSLRHEIHKNTQIEGDSIKTRTLLDQAVKIKAILDNMQENKCDDFAGPEFSIRSMTSINEEQMQRLIRNFSLMVLQAIHPIDSKKDYFKADPVEIIKILDNTEVTDRVVEDYLNEYRNETEIPRLIGLILSESGPRETVLGIMDGEAKRNLYERITQAFGKVFQKQNGGGMTDGFDKKESLSDYDALMMIVKAEDMSYDDKIVRMIRFAIDMIGRYKVTNESLQKDIIETNQHKEMIISRLASLESEIAVYRAQRDASDRVVKNLKLASVADTIAKIGGPVQADPEVIQQDENQLQKLQDKIGELEIALGISNKKVEELERASRSQQRGGQRVIEENTDILKNVLKDITTTMGDAVKNYSTQIGGDEQALLAELEELKGIIGTLKAELASITHSSENDHIKADLEEANSKIKLLSENLASCKYSSEEHETKYGKLLLKIEAIASAMKNNNNDRAQQLLTENLTESAPLMELFKTFQEKSSIVSPPVETYSPCFLNYFLGVFIQKLFFVKGSPNKLYSNLASTLQNVTTYYPLLDEMFAVLNLAESLTIDEIKSSNLNKYLKDINLDYNSDRKIRSHFQKAFPDLYKNANTIEIRYNSNLGVKSIPYLTLVAHYLVLARNYLVSTTLTGCSISKILSIDPKSFNRNRVTNSARGILSSVEDVLKRDQLPKPK